MLVNLRKLRTQQGISQKKLAEIVQVSQQSINKYENHNIEPDITTLKRLAEYFCVSVDYLIGHEEELTENNAVILSQQEVDLVGMFRILSPKKRDLVVQLIRSYSDKE